MSREVEGWRAVAELVASGLFPEGMSSDWDIEEVGDDWEYAGIVLPRTGTGKDGDGVSSTVRAGTIWRSPLPPEVTVPIDEEVAVCEWGDVETAPETSGIELVVEKAEVLVVPCVISASSPVKRRSSLTGESRSTARAGGATEIHCCGI